MLPLLVPSPVGSRVFPEVGPELYQRLPPGIAELAGLLQGAMEAESRRLWRRADFFWREFKTQTEEDEVLHQLVKSAAHDAKTVRKIRDQAYKKLRTAFAKQNYLQAFEFAERYLATSFLGASDKRKAAIYRLCNKAFVRWFVAQGDDLRHRHVQVD